jgi:hypothetical protein
MAIVTIFGGTFGDDEALAQSAAQTLAWPDVGREIFVAAAQRCGIPEAKLNELVEKEPHWWERWHENLRPYRIALKAAMSDAALAENIVYHGHVGHGLLPGIRHVMRVLLTAPWNIASSRCGRARGLIQERRAVTSITSKKRGRAV